MQKVLQLPVSRQRIVTFCFLHWDQTYLEWECALGPFWQKKWQLQHARLFTRWPWICFLFLYLKFTKFPLNLLCYTAMLVFFQKWPEPAQLNILSLGVTIISMVFLFEFSCFAYFIERATVWLVWSNPNESDRRPSAPYGKCSLVGT